MNEDQIIERAGKCLSYGKYPQTIYSGKCISCGNIFWTTDHACHAKGNCSRKCTNAKLIKSRNRTSNGYVVVKVPNHPTGKNNCDRVLEHVVVMEKMLGRYLKKGENVHHKNGIRTDNRPENLELWVRPQNPGQRVDDLISFVVDNYQKEVKAKLEVRELVQSVIRRVENDGTLSVLQEK